MSTIGHPSTLPFIPQRLRPERDRSPLRIIAAFNATPTPLDANGERAGGLWHVSIHKIPYLEPQYRLLLVHLLTPYSLTIGPLRPVTGNGEHLVGPHDLLEDPLDIMMPSIIRCLLMPFVPFSRYEGRIRFLDNNISSKPARWITNDAELGLKITACLRIHGLLDRVLLEMPLGYFKHCHWAAVKWGKLLALEVAQLEREQEAAIVDSESVGSPGNDETKDNLDDSGIDVQPS